MRYGVISDIHSNLEAFEAALARLEKEGVDGYIFCGDLIGYGPDPEKCVQRYVALSQQAPVLGVMGNHDAIVVHPELQEYFHFEALRVLEWSLRQLSNISLRCISFLPEVIRGENYTVVHGTPRDPLKEYFFNSLQYKMLFGDWDGQVLFVGHTHMPFYMEGSEKECKVISLHDEKTITLRSPHRYVINPGSVGKPRDKDVRAAFGVWDTEEQTFAFLREAYDFKLTQKKMKKAGLPDFLVESLSLGL